MTTSWRDIARNVICTVTKAAILYNGNPSEWDDEVKKAVNATIDAAYPFGVRANHPYQIWLDERKEALINLGIEERKPGTKQKGARSPKPKQDEIAPGQMSLF
jgi:hypothetical protein